MIKSLKVILWGEEIGRLAWDDRRHLSYFIYNPDFIKKGLSPNEAYEKSIGHYGRFSKDDGAVKYIDPRKE